MSRKITIEDYDNLPDFLSIELMDGRWSKGDWSELLIDDEVYEHPENPDHYTVYRLSIEHLEDMKFEIAGEDKKKFEKFIKQHEKCASGMDTDKFSYAFVPTVLGLATTVTCSCGETLLIGEFKECRYEECDNEAYKVWTEDDLRVKEAESAVALILNMKDARTYRMNFGQEQKFDVIYAYAVGVLSSKVLDNDKFIRLLPFEIRGMDVFKNGTEEEKIKCFYKLLEQKIKEVFAGCNVTERSVRKVLDN